MLSTSCRSPLAPSDDAMRGAAICHEQLPVWLGHTLVEQAADEGTKEIAVQCCPEDMLEPFARSGFGMKRFIQRLQNGSPIVSWCMAPYQVDSHFSRFEEPDVVVRLAGALQGEEVLHSADLFLGSCIGGVPVKRHPDHPRRRVADRHVVEATLLCEKIPGFPGGIETGVLQTGVLEK
jgi:hypothetical protein